MMGERKLYPIVRCHECDQDDEACYMEPTASRMIKMHLCFKCLFWVEKLEIDKGPHANRVARVAGTQYWIGDDPKRGDYASGLGYGGQRFHIRWHDGREKVTTNLWCNGKIPEHFKERLPDNAIFIIDAKTH